MPDRNFYRGRRVLITGHTGFLGSWLSTWLLDLGAELVGLSLVAGGESLFHATGLSDRMLSHFGDIRDAGFVRSVVARERPELVFHLAAQTLAHRGHREPVDTFATNVQGTVHVLEACRNTPQVRAIICRSSDACYENRGWDWGYRENDSLGGNEPCSASAAAAELVAQSYRRSYLEHAETPVGLASVRAGNLLGGGDAEDGRILPDALRALQRGEPVRLSRATLIRPWQHVLEVVAGYLALMPRLVAQPGTYSGPWNLGPLPENVVSVRELIERTVALWGGRIKTQLPDEDASQEPGHVRLAIDKAQSRLPWRPQWNLNTTLHHTLDWYRAFFQGADCDALHELCLAQIAALQASREVQPAPPPVILAKLSPRRASA